MIRFLAIAAVSAICLASTSASPPAVVVPVQPVPAYGPVYPDPGDLAQAVRELAAEVKLLREEMARLKASGPVAITAPKDPIGLAVKSCASCHSPTSAEEHGGGLAFFDRVGNLAFPTERDRQRAASRVRARSMPPPPAKLADGERKDLVELFSPPKK